MAGGLKEHLHFMSNYVQYIRELATPKLAKPQIAIFLFKGTWHVKGDSIHESNYICRRGPAMGVHGWKRGTGESFRKRMLS